MLIMTRSISLFIMIVCLVACVYGGHSLPSDKSLMLVLAYESRGSALPNVRWYLVQTEKGFSILEKNVSDGSGTVIEQAFKDRSGYHFVAWSEFLDLQGTAFEFVVPFDISKPAVRYTYQAGGYSTVQENGIYRPVPNNTTRIIVDRLIPVIEK